MVRERDRPRERIEATDTANVCLALAALAFVAAITFGLFRAGGGFVAALWWLL